MGEDLLREVAAATGLPRELIDSELLKLLKKAGLERSTLTLDDLRRVLAEYVQDVLLAARDELASNSTKGN